MVMTRKTFRVVLESGFNILWASLVIYFLSVMYRHSEPAPVQSNTGAQMGRALPIAGVNWSKHQHTLILGLSTSCSFCSASAPFYRELLDPKNQGDWQAVAVLPQSFQDAQKYTLSHGYSVENIQQSDLAVLGISATPTLLLLDQDGKL